MMDAIAERLITIEGSPAATMKEYLKLATIQEASGKEESQRMVQTLIEDFAALYESFQAGIELAEKDNDQVTGDLLTGLQGDLEKHSWMMRSFLG